MGSTASKQTNTTVVAVKAVNAFSSDAASTSTHISVPAPGATEPAAARSPNVTHPDPHKVAVVLSYHSSCDALAAKIADSLADACDVTLMSEARPVTLEHREMLISGCSVFMAIASIRYQWHAFLMEAVNYARTKDRKVVTVVGQPRYRPFGGLGAISIADGDLIDGVKWQDPSSCFALVAALKARLRAANLPPATPRPVFDAEVADSTLSARGWGYESGATGRGIAVSCHTETAEVVALLEAETFNAPIDILNESSSAHSPVLEQCTVLIAVFSPQYERSASLKEQYERARALRKSIIPLIGYSRYSPSGWAALAIAGKLFYKFHDRDTAYTNGKRTYLDTVPMTEFKLAINAHLVSLPDPEAREKVEIGILTKKIEECRNKLRHWPPKKHETLSLIRDPPKLTMAELLADQGNKLRMKYTHYTITRMSIAVPKPLFDSRGVPIRERLDVFISYQWDQQEFVRSVHQDMQTTFSMKMWMDVYGGMLGNTNEAMANGIECSDVFMCFLSSKYLCSGNCILEVRYTLYRKRALVFILTEDDLVMPGWIGDIVNNNITFVLRSIADCGRDDNGIPRLNRICEAIRLLSARSHRAPFDEDVTETVSDMRCTLEDALLDLAEQENTSRWQTCTRCGANFDDNTRAGCRKHRAYYVGGNIIAGRWVCCTERSKDGMGCVSTDHTTERRTFTLMPAHGTHKWEPA